MARELTVEAVEDDAMRFHTDVMTLDGEEGFHAIITTSMGFGGVGIYLRAEKDGKTVRERIDLTSLIQAWTQQVDEEMSS